MTKQISLFVLSLFFVSNLIAQDRAHLKKQIDKIIHYDTELKLSETPGLVIGVKIQDSIYFYGFGSVSKEFDKMPNENTIFEIGGLTKAFTGSLVSALVADGQMDYEKSFNEYIPVDEKNDELQKVTIDQLVTHTSKMPRMPMEFGVKELVDNNPYAYYTQNDLMTFYKNYIPLELNSKKKKKKKDKNVDNYLYSHLNYALLERAIEKSQNQNFENVLATRVLNPIGLNDTRIQLSKEQQKRLATGYTTSGHSTPPWTFQSFKASEGLKSTAKDLMKFAEVHIGSSHPELTQKFEATTEGRKKTGLSKRVEISRGWHIISATKKSDDIIAHTGNTNGHRAYLAFVKETETAVVILSNSEHNLHNLGYLILSMTNGYWK